MFSLQSIFANGTIVRFDGILWSSPSACLPFCLRPGEENGGRKLGYDLSLRFQPKMVVPCKVELGLD